MPAVEIPLGDRSYTVHIGAGLLRSAQPWKANLAAGPILVVTNDVVAPLYLDRLLDSIGPATVETLILPDGEAQKNIENWSKILDKLVSMRAGRDATLITLGGGVVGDLGGFAAASYMRGIGFIQAPTTLLAQVDASVGGKTAFNHPLGKNLVGAFYQPLAVVADTESLGTLPIREFRAGLAEVIKYGALMDADFFSWLEDRVEAILAQDAEVMAAMIRRCVENKARIVAEDERESGRRALLNLGHSFAHALELIGKYDTYLHGEAVAIGMVVAARLSERRNLCDAGTSQRLAALLTAFGLPVRVPGNIGASQVLDAMSRDKKNSAGTRRLILLDSIGRARVDTGSSDDDIKSAIEDCRS